jgi:hypothetical protein
MEILAARMGRRDDYGTLLNAGQVIRRLDEVDDPDAWRSEIRSSARSDRIRIRTGKTDGIVWALLSDDNPARAEESDRWQRILRSVVQRAAEHRHEPAWGLRDGDEGILRCERCDAIGYVDGADGPDRPVVGGRLFEEDCPDPAPPVETALTQFFGPGRRR